MVATFALCLIAADPPRLLLLRPEALATAGRRLADGDPATVAALAELRDEAQAALVAGPWSVMNKPVTPPSGDKHDYMSVGPYWWPDPTKPDGLPYIRRDGEVNPDRNSDADDSVGLGKTVAATETLALAYYFTRDGRYAERAALLARTWFLDDATRMNPHLNYGQAIPGRTEGRGIGIIDTRGLPQLIDAIGLLAGSPSWTAADDAALRQWFGRYLDWLLTSRHGQDESREANNHGTWYDVQVAAFARYAGRDDVARRVLAEVGTRRIATQIEPDGRQPHELARTKSFSYSAMNLRGFYCLASLAEPLGIDLWNYRTEDGRCLRAALDHLAPFADASVVWPHEQIGDAGYRHGLAPLLRAGRRIWGEARYAALEQKLAVPTRLALTDPAEP